MRMVHGFIATPRTFGLITRQRFVALPIEIFSCLRIAYLTHCRRTFHRHACTSPEDTQTEHRASGSKLAPNDFPAGAGHLPPGLDESRYLEICVPQRNIVSRPEYFPAGWSASFTAGENKIVLPTSRPTGAMM